MNEDCRDDGAALGRNGARYLLTSQQVQAYARDGYLVLPNVLTDAELTPLEACFGRFIRGEVRGMGRDFCDMSGPYERAFEDFNLVNAVLPRSYDSALIGNLFEQRATSIACQLIGIDATLDYDQFLAKRPNRPKAVFAWHQDLGRTMTRSTGRLSSMSLPVERSATSNTP